MSLKADKKGNNYTFEYRIHFNNGSRGRKRMCKDKAPVPRPVEPGRIPRVSRLVALAIRFEELLKKGEARDYADLARLGHVTRARMTQIMNLLQLAPGIQEDILFLPRIMKGRDPVTEHDVRPIAAEIDWAKQRQDWALLKKANYSD